MADLPSSGFLGALRSQQLLEEIAALRRRARRPVGLWPPLAVFGTAAVVGAPLGMLGDTALNLWWAVVAVPAFILVAVFSHRHGHRQGVESPSRLLCVLGVGSFAAGLLICAGIAAATDLPDGAGWVLAVAGGYLAWSGMARSIPVAAVAGAILVVGMALVWSPAPTWTVQLGVGLAMVAGAVALRLRWEAA